jgi:hypothetical protein
MARIGDWFIDLHSGEFCQVVWTGGKDSPTLCPGEMTDAPKRNSRQTAKPARANRTLHLPVSERALRVF